MGNSIETSLRRRRSKVVSLADAVDHVENGMRIALGGFAVYQRPMAFVREMIRRGKRDLTLVGVVNSIETDMLIAAGALRRVETSYMGFEKYGLAPNFRRACQEYGFDTVDYPELLAWDRFRADQEGLDFWPTRGLGGTDVVNRNREIREFVCPITGKILHALPGAKPDIGVIHAVAADETGNVIVPTFHTLAQSFDVTLSRSCQHVIATVEKVVTANFLKRHSHLVQIPAARISAVVELPFGAHPTSMLGRYADDDDHWQEYIAASKTEEGVAAYLENYVYGAEDNAAYLNLIGGARIAALLQVDTQK